MAYNLLINGVYWGYNPLTKLLLTCWDILVVLLLFGELFFKDELGHTPAKLSIASEKRWLEDDPFLLVWYMFRGYVQLPGGSQAVLFLMNPFLLIEKTEASLTEDSP